MDTDTTMTGSASGSHTTMAQSEVMLTQRRGAPHKHTAHCTGPALVARTHRLTDGQFTADGAAMSCKGERRRGRRRHWPWSVLSLQGRRTPHYSFRVVGFPSYRGGTVMGTSFQNADCRVVGCIFVVISCRHPWLTGPGLWETRTEVGDGKDCRYYWQQARY